MRTVTSTKACGKKAKPRDTAFSSTHEAACTRVAGEKTNNTAKESNFGTTIESDIEDNSSKGAKQDKDDSNLAKAPMKESSKTASFMEKVSTTSPRVASFIRANFETIKSTATVS